MLELGIGIYTGSILVISDTFHTFSAVGGVVLALVAGRIALNPADKNHTFGSLRVADNTLANDILTKANDLLRPEFGFHLSTLQIETACLDEDHAKNLDILNLEAVSTGHATHSDNLIG